jgi:hypothetical protein
MPHAIEVPMRISTLVLLPLALGCYSPTAPDALGTWGGQEASLVLAASGGELSYACGAGTVDAGWTLSREGQFVASGEHFFGGGPVPPQGRPPHPARYSGRVQGDDFTLTVTLTDLKQTLGPFHLVRGGPSVFEQCL